MFDLTPEEQEEFDLALVAGLVRRFGPTNAELETWPRWKKALCRMIPRKQRWRLSVNAPLIREFETRL